MIKLSFIVTFCSGLIAGLFYAYSCSVNPGLKNLSNPDYLKAMSAINCAIKNVYFFIVFMGLIVLYPIHLYSLFRVARDASFYLTLTAASIYFIGVFGVTVVGNVPLNEVLARFDISLANPSEIDAMREVYEKSWNTYHAIRTGASIVSFALMLLAICRYKSD